MRKIAADPGSIEITPLIDVLFLLLVFLVLSRASMDHAVRVEIPELSDVEQIVRSTAVIRVNRENGIQVDGREITRRELETHLQAFAKLRRPVLLESDRRADMGVVLDVWDMCRLAGIKELSIKARKRTIGEHVP